jgi:hypothetical protein
MWYSLADDHIRSLLHITRDHLAHAHSETPARALGSRG